MLIMALKSFRWPGYHPCEKLKGIIDNTGWRTDRLRHTPDPRGHRDSRRIPGYELYPSFHEGGRVASTTAISRVALEMPTMNKPG